jgi:hypothetical protein
MTYGATRKEHKPVLEPLDETVDHIPGSPVGRLIPQCGDYECPCSRQAFRAIERVEREMGGVPASSVGISR